MVPKNLQTVSFSQFLTLKITMFLYSVVKFGVYININICNVFDFKNGIAWFELPVCQKTSYFFGPLVCLNIVKHIDLPINERFKGHFYDRALRKPDPVLIVSADYVAQWNVFSNQIYSSIKQPQ